MPNLFREKKGFPTKQERMVDRCSIFDCSEPAIGKFKPDSRKLCSEHGVKYCQDWRERIGNPQATALLGIIVQ